MSAHDRPSSEFDIVEDDFDAEVPPPAEGLAALMLTLVALVLLLLAPVATRLPPAGKGWYLAPVTWPALCLGMAAVAGIVLGRRLWTGWRTATDPAAFRRQAVWAFGGIGQALEYSLWFCLYLLGVSYLGFAIATIAFLQFVVWRAGLRGRRWAFTALTVAIAIILIFRLGIGLWFPLPPMVQMLPAWVGNTFGAVL
jgi:hypothetical protein